MNFSICSLENPTYVSTNDIPLYQYLLMCVQANMLRTCTATLENVNLTGWKVIVITYVSNIAMK